MGREGTNKRRRYFARRWLQSAAKNGIQRAAPNLQDDALFAGGWPSPGRARPGGGMLCPAAARRLVFSQEPVGLYSRNTRWASRGLVFFRVELGRLDDDVKVVCLRNSAAAKLAGWQIIFGEQVKSVLDNQWQRPIAVSSPLIYSRKRFLANFVADRRAEPYG